MKEERVMLVKKKEDLELQTNDLNLPLPEARERLQNRIKEDNVVLKQMDKDMLDVSKTVEQYKQNIKEIDNELRNQGNNQPGEE